MPMRRLIITLLFSAITCLSPASVSWSGTHMTRNDSGKGQVGGGESLRVLWTVSGYKRTDAATWGENEAKSMLFKPLDIDNTSITFDRKKCENISFERKAIKASEYLQRNYHVTPQWLDI